MIEPNKKTNMKKAYIEQILMSMVIFIGFIWSFLFVAQYAAVLRTHDSMDAMGNYGARFVSNLNDQTTVAAQAALFTNLNNLSIDSITDVTTADIVCAIAAAAPQATNSQSIFITQGTYNKGYFKDKVLTSRIVVYNERSQAQITCNLNISIN